MVRRKSHSMKARSEFEQGVEHFRAAAAHAARGTGATIGPKFDAARERVQPVAGRVRDTASSGWGSAIPTLAPLAAAVTEGARQANKKTDKTSKAGKKNAKKLDSKARKAMGRKQSGGKGKLLGLGIAGLALGALGAMAMRKRRQEQWDEYDPSQPIGAVGTEAIPATPTTTVTTAASPAASATTIGDTRDQTDSTMHSPTVAKMAGGESPS